MSTTAELVLRRNVSGLMSEAGCVSAKDCFLYLYANDPASGVDNWLSLAELKDSSLQKAQVTVSRSQPRRGAVHMMSDVGSWVCLAEPQKT